MESESWNSSRKSNLVIFKTTHGDYKALCQQEEYYFHFCRHGQIICVEFDPEKMEILLSNLISNAFRYSEGGKSYSSHLKRNKK